MGAESVFLLSRRSLYREEIPKYSILESSTIMLSNKPKLGTSAQPITFHRTLFADYSIFRIFVFKLDAESVKYFPKATPA